VHPARQGREEADEMTPGRTLDRSRLERLMADEMAAFERANPRSRALFERAKVPLLDGVPMNWMIKWAGPCPLFVESASGAHFADVDGHEYVDFCLGDTGAMAGHGPDATIRAVEAQLRRGITHMLPTEDAIIAGDELRRRFGPRYWQFTLTATDANRFVIRLARHITGRAKILVHNHRYHGSVDETFAVIGPDGEAIARHGTLFGL
jgi:glutamate-1-semialdehyde 2,1-aminomutase